MLEPLDDIEIEHTLKIELPPKPARAGWQVNRTELIKALAHLEIEYPVKIRYIKGIYRRGSHYARSEPVNHHRITIHQDLAIDVANKVLWHELVHARQSEQFVIRTGKPHNRFYEDEYKAVDGAWGVKYKENLYEIECNDRAEANRGWRLLH